MKRYLVIVDKKVSLKDIVDPITTLKANLIIDLYENKIIKNKFSTVTSTKKV